MARNTGRASPVRRPKSASTRTASAARTRPMQSPAPAVATTAKPAISPLAPSQIPKLPPLAGVRLAAGAANIRYKDRTDLLLAVLAPGTQVAGVFTRSKTASAPVEWCRENLAGGSARMLVVNSGNANAFTGAAGMDSEIGRAHV